MRASNFLVVVTCLVFSACSDGDKETGTPLARVGDHVISVEEFEAWLTVLGGGSRTIMVALLCYTLYLILRYRREDLVEPRRLLRLTVIVIIGGYILAVVGVETLNAAPFPLWMELAHSIGIMLSTLAFVSVLAGPDQLEVARIVSAMEAGYRSMTTFNKAFKAYSPKGWRFADMEPYVDNNDQKGVWVTFVKPVLP